MKRLFMLLLSVVLAVCTVASVDLSYAKNKDNIRQIWIVTNEIKVPAKDGQQEIEVYRWDPGTIVLHQGERVMLNIYGVKGKSHPFELEGYNIKGVAIQGQVTKILFTADKVGTFPFVCLTHADLEHHGPMIAYFEVLP